MATTDTTATKTAESGADGDAAKTASGNAAKGTRRKLNDAQEREVTRLYAATETPVSEISKRFGIGESSVYRVAQRHGAALRGRTATSAKSTGRPAAKVAKTATKTAAKTAAPGGRGRGRGRAPGTGTAKTAAKTAVKTAKTATKTAAKTAAKTTAKTAAKSTGNGRRTRGAAAPAKRTSALAVKAAGATRAPRGTRTAAGVRREFRVSYAAVRVFVAANMADAIRQAEAAGATDITGIERRA